MLSKKNVGFLAVVFLSMLMQNTVHASSTTLFEVNEVPQLSNSQVLEVVAKCGAGACGSKDEHKCGSKDEHKCGSKDEHKCGSKDEHKCGSKDGHK